MFFTMVSSAAGSVFTVVSVVVAGLALNRATSMAEATAREVLWRSVASLLGSPSYISIFV